MNIFINRLDNLAFDADGVEFIPETIKKEHNIDGRIVGSQGTFSADGVEILGLIKNSFLSREIGERMFDSMLRKPKMIFLLPTSETEFEAPKDSLDLQIGIKEIHFNNFAQAFSIGCWFIKDSCVTAQYSYGINLFRNFYSQSNRDMTVTMSNGSISEVYFSDSELSEAIRRMYEIYALLLPEESKMGKIEWANNSGTMVWNIDKAISSEGKSFARALITLQEARRTGNIPSKIEKYCQLLEGIYVIDNRHRNNISTITAAYIGNDDNEREEIRSNLCIIYRIRSEHSHGDTLSYLKSHEIEELENLSTLLDDYVRRVMKKVILDRNLNYKNNNSEKEKVKKYFQEVKKGFYPDKVQKENK